MLNNRRWVWGEKKATVKDDDTLAITIAILPIVLPQMPIRFLAYITYAWYFNKAWHPDRPPLVHCHMMLCLFRMGFWKKCQSVQTTAEVRSGEMRSGEVAVPHPQLEKNQIILKQKTIWLPTTNYFQSIRTQLITESLRTLWRHSKQTKCSCQHFGIKRPITKVSINSQKANTDDQLQYIC